ncbi:MAG: homoserine O-acetyltransferase [Gammaproteobacteria bacterium]|jgi:homoserine O-acetyltransferase
MSDYEVFELGDLPLQCGRTLPQARLAYKTYGKLAKGRNNVILYPTSYGAQHSDTEWLIGPGRVLDTTRWFVVVPNMFTNGLSSSPSNCVPELRYGRWPKLTHVDNVAAQRRLLREVFGIENLALVYGWSMGAQQALHWGALYPDEVARICAVCGSARTSPHNRVFLEGVKAALTGDVTWRDGWFEGKPERGLRAMGRVYAGWALSQAFYRERLYEQFGARNIEDYLVRVWEANFLRRDGNDLLAQIQIWMDSDISANERYNGDLTAALSAIQARATIMPGSHDLYFTAEDSARETASMPNAEFLPIDSIHGHRAGNPTHNPVDEAVLRTAVAVLLADS